MRFLFSLLLILSFLSLGSILTETASLREFIYGTTDATSYDNWLSHTSEGVLEVSPNTYPPFDRQLNGFGDYNVPNDSEEEIWSELVTLFLADNLEEVDLIIAQNELPFETVIFHDVDTNRDYHILREVLNNEYFDDNDTESSLDDVTGSFDFGWGIYIRDLQSTSHVLVNVVHPNDDFIAVPVAVKAFQDWNAKFLFINGSGREVGGSTQRSDPSRTSSHPFNAIYSAACDQIRTETSRRELSAQIHSYDWDKHEGFAACQISAGNYRSNPNLPIRDVSDLKRDLVNLTDYLVIPQNTIGSNQQVLLDDYYSVYCNNDFTYFHFEEEYEVNTSIDLPGYSGNKQMLYSSPMSLNQYDVQEPFFHLEMDELPNCYPQFEIDYNLFYGVDLVTDLYDEDHIYDNALAFYAPWVDAFTEALVYLNEFDDNSIPEIPGNLHSLNELSNQTTIVWERVSDYEFESYEVLYAQESIGDDNYQVINRENYDTLAAQEITSIELDEFIQLQDYYVKIRAKDYNGNISELSDECFIGQIPAITNSFEAMGLDSESVLSWDASWINDFQGFTLYRSEDGGYFQEIASYEDDEALQLPIGNSGEFEYVNTELDNGVLYRYKLTAVNNDGLEYAYPLQAECWTSKIYTLELSSGEFTKVLKFSANGDASNFYDSHDIPQDPYNEEEFYISFTILYGAYNYLEQNVINSFNIETEKRYLDLLLRSSSPGIEMQLSTDYFSEGGEGGLYLKNVETGELHDFYLGSAQLTLEDSNSTYYDLIWGNLEPSVYLNAPISRIFKEGEQAWVNWDINNREIISSMKLQLKNENSTIELMNNISPRQDSVFVTMPSGYNEHNLELEMVAETNSGKEYSFQMDGFFGLIEAMQGLAFQQGWQTVAYPFLDEGLNLAQVFGDDYLCYDYNQNAGFQPDPTLDISSGNLVYFPAPTTYYDSEDFQADTYALELLHGWNLIPNKYPMDIPVSSFQINNHWASESMESGVIAPLFVVYDEGQYKQVEILKASQSGFLFYNYNGAGTLRIAPYSNGWALPMFESQAVEVSFAQGNKAHFRLGYAEESGGGYDLSYDLPAYPELPDNSVLQAYIIPSEANDECPFDYLSQEYLAQLEDPSTEELVWAFELIPASLEPIEIYLSEYNLPDNYEVLLSIGGNESEITDGTFVYNPQSIDVVQGQITVKHESYTGIEDIEVAVEEFKNYPNPFNPETIFSFSVEEESVVELEIYNLKGQKITNLINEVMPMGKYERSWNGCDRMGNLVATGVYLGRLKIGDRHFKRKLLLLK